VITTAAAIMITVFASFVLNTDPVVKMLATGMAFAVLIDASVVRLVLVPSIMTLLGARAWWMPKWLEPVVPHLQLEGGDAEPAPPAGAPRESAPHRPPRLPHPDWSPSMITDSLPARDTANSP
jgi:RND superfamily putative drug exporter